MNTSISTSHKRHSSPKRIAVVIPAYNIDSYLRECLESLQNQSYGDFIAYIVDDGSTDNTRHIADYFSETDSRFQVFHKQNKGVASARNFALDQIAQAGHFAAIAFLDGDDKLNLDCFLQAINAMVREDVDCVFFGYRVFDKSGYLPHEEYSPSERTLKNTTEIYDLFFNCYPLENQKARWFLSNKLFRAECVANTRFCEDMRRGEDVRFFIDLRSNLRSLTVIPDTLLEYRLRKSSLSHGSLNVLSDLKFYSDLILNQSNKFTTAQTCIIKSTLLNIWRKSLIFTFSQSQNKKDVRFLVDISKKLYRANILTGFKNKKRLMYLLLGNAYMYWWSSYQYHKINKKIISDQKMYFD